MMGKSVDMASLAVELAARLVGAGNSIAIPRIFIKMTGSYIDAAILSQLLYWYGRMGHREFYKSDAELGHEVLVCERTLARARKRLARFGVKTRRRGLPARLYYDIDVEMLEYALREYMAKNATDEQGGGGGEFQTSPDSESPSPDSETVHVSDSESGHTIYTKDYDIRLHHKNTSKNSFASELRSADVSADADARVFRGGNRRKGGGEEDALDVVGHENENTNDTELERLTLAEFRSNEPQTEPNTADSRTGRFSPGAGARAGRRGAVSVSRLIDAYNEHCGPLPQARTLSASRQSALKRLVDEHGYERALELLIAATRQVASDPFWVERGYGLDNLLRPGRIVEKAEKHECQARGRAGARPLAQGEQRMVNTYGRIMGAIGGNDD